MRRGWLPLLALALLLPGRSVGAEAAAPEAALTEAARRELAQALLDETNRVRQAHGRRALRSRPPLDAAADDQAAFMALTLTAQHTSLVKGQRTLAERIGRHGLEGAFVAENVVSYPVGEDAAPPPARAIAAMLVAQWMASPGHRANLLDRNFTHMGGAVRLVRVFGRQWCAFGVQVFFTPRSPIRRGA